MKKKLILALLTALLLLLASSYALAENYPTHSCDCGENTWSTWKYSSEAQHYSFCIGCGAPEYGDHYGGMATCIAQAICEGCGSAYGTTGNNHFNLSGWEYFNDALHTRFCLDCGAPDTKEFGSHSGSNGSCIAFCNDCGSRYLDLNGKHNMSGWMPYDDTQHYRYCLDCNLSSTYEYASHTGGTATCQTLASCEGCGASYGEPDPNNHDWGDWEGFSASTHIRVCLNCVEEEEAPHTGGDGACWTTCAECGWDYSNPDGEHRNLSDWYPYSMTQHYRECLDCAGERYTEYGEHQGGDGSCRPTCEDCGAQYTDENGKHSNMCDWFYNDAAQHRRYCLDCGTYESNEYEDHYGGTATCTKRAVCEGCGTEYGDRSDVHPWGEWEYLDGTNHERRCTNPDCHASDYANHSGGDGSCWTECEDCGYHYNNAEGQHRTMSVWYYLNGAQHMRHCVDCGYGKEYEDHTGGTATCSEQAVCEVCGEGYGELDGTRHGDFSDWETIGETQHSRYCLDCGANEEYEDHYGGTATCSSRAICEGCGSSYGDLALDVHLHMSEWEPYAGGHERSCLDCHSPDSIERAPHTGDGACQSACIDCHENFIDPNGEHSITDWLPVNGTQHERYCDRCYGESTYEYADHVGDGTCTSECKDCGMTFTDPDGTHRLTEWRSHSSEQHIRYCPDCELERTFEYGEHRPNANAEDLPCYKSITCADCDYNMGWGTQHSLSDWVPYSTLQHIRYCTVGGIDHVVEYDLHYGGTATCSELAVCEACGGFYGDLAADAHTWGEWKPDANGTHTRVCTLDPTHTETADCTWGDWTHLTHIHHERRCTVCNGQELGEHTGGTLTCYSPRICDVCNEGYGSPDNSGLSGHPNPVIEQKAPTCYDEGYYRVTCDHPGCSMPFFEIILPANGQHLYNHWDILGDHQHHTNCAQCGENTDVACTLWGMYDGETLLTVCPACGDFLETPFELLFARDDVAVPIGTLLVRGTETPFEGALYGITVAGVYGGEVVDIHGKVTVTLPVALESFSLVRVDVTDGVETRTEVPFTLENGQLTFTTNAAGLFLLVPAE